MSGWLAMVAQRQENWTRSKDLPRLLLIRPFSLLPPFRAGKRREIFGGRGIGHWGNHSVSVPIRDKKRPRKKDREKALPDHRLEIGQIDTEPLRHCENGGEKSIALLIPGLREMSGLFCSISDSWLFLYNSICFCLAAVISHRFGSLPVTDDRFPKRRDYFLLPLKEESLFSHPIKGLCSCSQFFFFV